MINTAIANNPPAYIVSNNWKNLGVKGGKGDLDGSRRQFFLTVDVWQSGFGSLNSYVETYVGKTPIKTDKTNNPILVNFCAPTACASEFFRCSTNYNVTELINPAYGGSLEVSTQSYGVNPPTVKGCMRNTTQVIYMRYTLYGMMPGPTFAPTFAAGQSPPLLPESKTLDSLNNQFNSKGGPFYIIAIFSIAFAVAAIKLSNLREKANKRIVHIKQKTAIINMTLIGSGLISEVFFLSILLAGSSYIYLASIIIAARSLHLISSSIVVFYIIGPVSFSAKYVDLLEYDHLLLNSKIYGSLMLASIIETPILRFLPWRTSMFAGVVCAFCCQ